MAIGGAVIAGLGLAYGVANDRMQRSDSKKAQRAQDSARRAAAGNAARETRTQREEFARANPNRPNTAALLAAAQRDRFGVSSTRLSGGVDPSQLRLGQPKALGA